MASTFKGTDHIEPPDHKGPSYGDCLEGSGRHMALICKKLATDTVLDKVLCVCPGCRPVETYAESLAYERPSCGMVAAESGMNFGQELPPFLFGDTPLEHSGSAFLIKLSLVDLVGFRASHVRTMQRASFWSSGSSCLFTYAKKGSIHGAMTTMIMWAEGVISVAEPPIM